MITFLSQQSNCARHACKNENADTVNFTPQIASLICTASNPSRGPRIAKIELLPPGEKYD